MTLAARLLRVYISETSPSEELRDLVAFIVKHYVPMWFEIRLHCYSTSGPDNFCRSLQYLRQLPSHLQACPYT